MDKPECISAAKAAVSSVFNHQEPDYIPLGTYAIDCDTVEKIIGHETYVRNKLKIRLALWEGRRDEVAQSLKEDSVELFKKLDCVDVIIPHKEAQLLPPAGYERPKVKKLEENVWEDDKGIIYKLSEPTNDILPIKIPPVPAVFPEENPVFNPPDESIFEAYDHLVKALKHERVLLGLSGGFDIMPLLGGMENGLMEYLLNPELVMATIAYHTKRANFNDPFYINRGTDYVMAENDMAATNGPLISPQTFREMVFPAMCKRISHIKRFTDKVVLHCCGKTFKLIDMFIEAGVDCEQSLQTTACMDIKVLKENYGKQLCFWGGVAVENLISGTIDEVRADVRHAYESARHDGGFILGPSHSIAYGVKYDNFMAMLDEHDRLKYKS